MLVLITMVDACRSAQTRLVHDAAPVIGASFSTQMEEIVMVSYLD